MSNAIGGTGPVDEVIAKYPKLLDTLSAFLVHGGEQLLIAMNDTFRQDAWPWDREAQTQASYGAFCGGVAWSTKLLRTLHKTVAHKAQFDELMAAGDSDTGERTRRILINEYGYTEADFQQERKELKNG